MHTGRAGIKGGPGDDLAHGLPARLIHGLVGVGGVQHHHGNVEVGPGLIAPGKFFSFYHRLAKAHIQVLIALEKLRIGVIEGGEHEQGKRSRA